jgi:hypothetical protein
VGTWSPPAFDLDLEASATWPESIFANPVKRRGPLLNSRFVSLVVGCFDVFADNDVEREIAYERVLQAAKHFKVPITARSWRELSRNGRTKPAC